MKWIKIKKGNDHRFIAIGEDGKALKPVFVPGKPTVQTKTPTPTPMSCAHLGKDLGVLADCIDGCKSAKLKVFECAKHGSCTIARKGRGIAGCCSSPSAGKCPDYQERV